MTQNFQKDKIFIEKGEKIRLIIQQEIGLDKILDKIKEEFKAEVFTKNDEIIILIEKREEEIKKELNDTEFSKR